MPILYIVFMLLFFGAVSFIQNMAFTASSRSRNSGDPTYHRWCSYASNGVYYITNALLTLYIVRYQQWWMLALQGVVYTLSTAEGSVLMMRKMLAKEKGKRAVGAGQDLATFTGAEGNQIRQLLLDRFGPNDMGVGQGRIPSGFGLSSKTYNSRGGCVSGA